MKMSRSFNVYLYFKVQEKHRRQRQNESRSFPDNFSNSRPARSTYEGEEWLETCRAYCEIHSVEDGIRFCHSLYPQNQPSICRRMSSPPQINASFSSTFRRDISEIEDEEDDENFGIRTERSIPRPSSGPSMVYFNVKLKINDVLMLPDPWGGREESPAAPGECLYLPIKHVAFSDSRNEPFGPEGFLGLSCHSKYLLTQCYIDCPNNTALNRQLEAIQEEEELLDAMNFWLYGSLVVIAWIAMSVVEVSHISYHIIS